MIQISACQARELAEVLMRQLVDEADTVDAIRSVELDQAGALDTLVVTFQSQAESASVHIVSVQVEPGMIRDA